MILERFDEKFIPEPTSGCWLWLGQINNYGYGTFWLNGKQRRAHRVSYALNVGSIPNEAVVRHTCDNRACVNPAHLRIGTTQDNADDCVRRNRSAYGTRHGRSRFTEAQIIEIRQRRANGETLQAIARAFKTGHSTISYIVGRGGWERAGGPLSPGKWLRAHKLSLEQIGEIQRRHRGGETQQSLADEFGVKQPHISRVCSGKRRHS